MVELAKTERRHAMAIIAQRSLFSWDKTDAHPACRRHGRCLATHCSSNASIRSARRSSNNETPLAQSHRSIQTTANRSRFPLNRVNQRYFSTKPPSHRLRPAHNPPQKRLYRKTLEAQAELDRSCVTSYNEARIDISGWVVRRGGLKREDGVKPSRTRRCNR